MGKMKIARIPHWSIGANRWVNNLSPGLSSPGLSITTLFVTLPSIRSVSPAKA
jgi:hypothetical protein